jgi:hypothetical protein
MKTNSLPTVDPARRMACRIALVLALLGVAGDGLAQRGVPRPAPTPSDSPQAAPANGAPAGRTPNDRFARRRQIMAVKAGGGLATGPVTDPLLIPGLAPRPPASSGINVLQRVFLDPASGELVFVGRLDPAYPTGPIDYSTLLADAIRSPTPSFSLEPTAASKAASAGFVQQFDRQMQSNLSSIENGKAWLIGIFDQLLTNPSLEVDRRRFLAKGAAIFKVPPEEIPAFVQAVLGRTEMGSPPWINFWARTFENLGAPAAATYMRAAANKDSDPYAFQASLDGLGLRPVIEELRSGMQSGAIPESVAYARLEVATWNSIYSRCGIPESRWRAAGEQAGRIGDTTAFRTVIDAINADLVREKVMDPWLNGLVLSETFLQVMNLMPALQVAPVCSDGLAPDSELAHTFLAADWMLKNLGVTPELKEKVPGHRTPSEFTFELETARRVYDTGDVNVRMWLQPGTVELRHDSGRRVIEFDRANMVVHTSVIAHGRSGSAAAQQLARDAAAGYATEVTRRYDDYARALPDLHRLRESAKVIALAQWARQQGLRLVPPTAPVRPGPLPAAFQRGFWTGNFHSNPEKTFFGLVAIGGVDFGPDVGGAWVQPREDNAVANSALRQLGASALLGRQAADAALAGDLESARALADQSALAMTGELNLQGHPALGAIPEVPPPPPVTDIQLQTEALLRSNQAIADLVKVRQGIGPADLTRADAEDHVRKLQGLLTPGERSPEEARQYVKFLRNGEWASLPAPAATSTPYKPVVPTVPVAPPSGPRAPAVAAAPVAPAAPVPNADEKIRIRGEITALRTELCRVNAQLRRFNATIQQDQAMRAEWEIRVNDAYESALSAAKSKLADFTLDFPDEKLNERIEKLTDPAERAKYERARKMLVHLRESYRLGDFAKWAEHEEYTRAEVIEGMKIIAEIFDVEEKIKEQLSRRWGLKRVIAFQEAASDLVTAAFDVTSEVVAWRRLNQLNRNSEDYLRAVEATARRQREVMEGIRQREIRLGLDPGSTKEPCEF